MTLSPLDLETLLEKAQQIAKDAHQGQLDKAGKPYIEHPLRVMNSLETVEAKIVAVLHDTVEDSDLTLDTLVDLGFPPQIVNAIDAITKRQGEDYNDYIDRVTSNPLALQVKIADMRDNMDMNRLPHPTERDYQRLRKYQKTLPRLLSASKKD